MKTPRALPDQAALAAMNPEERETSFSHQPVGRRAAIIAAGPIANFILAIVIFAAIFALYGKQTTTARVDAVQPDSPAAAAGLRPGDIVVAIDGREVESFSDMQRIVSANAGRTLEFQIDRGGAPMTIKATPTLRQGKDGLGNNYCHAVLGRQPLDDAGRREDHAGQSTDRSLAWRQGNLVSSSTARSLIIGGLFVGRECADQLGGPIRIAQVSGQVADARLRAASAAGGGAVGLDRPFEPVPGAAARWRPPFVPGDRGYPRPAAV